MLFTLMSTGNIPSDDCFGIRRHILTINFRDLELFITNSLSCSRKINKFMFCQKNKETTSSPILI